MRKVVGVLVVALAITGCGGSTSSSRPNTPPPASVAPATPTPAAPGGAAGLLARGSFRAQGAAVELDATGGASSVTGNMIVSPKAGYHGDTFDGDFTVDLECTRTINGLLWIGGDVAESTNTNTPAGTRAAIVLKRGSPVRAIFVWQGEDPRSASCQAFFDDMIAPGPIVEGDMAPIEGTLELGP
jgi:hypothetical protein